MDTMKLVVGQKVLMTCHIFPRTGRVMEVSPSSVRVKVQDYVFEPDNFSKFDSDVEFDKDGKETENSNRNRREGRHDRDESAPWKLNRMVPDVVRVTIDTTKMTVGQKANIFSDVCYVNTVAVIEVTSSGITVNNGMQFDKNGKETTDSRYNRLGLRADESGPGPEFGFWEVDDNSWTNAEALRREVYGVEIE